MTNRRSLVHRLLWIAAPLTVLAIASACSLLPPPPGSPGSPDSLAGKTWLLVSYGSPDAPRAVLGRSEITLTFDPAVYQAGGSSGCNSYFASYSASGGAIRFSDVGSTMMACEDDLMAQESDYLALLVAVRSFAVEDDRLKMTAADGQMLTFRVRGEDTAPPAGTSALAITSPQAGAVIDPSRPVVIAGTGQGLFEGNVVVQIVDAGGRVLAEQATILQGEEVGIGGAGVWSVELQAAAEPGTAGQIIAFSPSPADDEGDLARASISVTFGGQ